MFTRYTATLTALLTLGIASFAQAQQSTSDTTRNRGQRDLATDTMKLQRDTVRLDSARALLSQDQMQAKTDQKQLDSLKAGLKQAQQTGDTAAIAKDQAAITALRKQLDSTHTQAQREEHRIDVTQKAVQSDTREVKADKAVSLNGDRNQDQRALARDTTKLQLDRTQLDSARVQLNTDRTMAQADEKQIDSLQAGLKQARQKGDTAAIASDKAAITALRQKMDTAQDAAHREEHQVDLAQKAVQREQSATIETRQDIKQDKPGSKPESKTAPKKH
jgi:hypothetical protein